MRRLVREAVVVMGSAVLLAGPVSAVAVPLAPAAWRRPSLAWAILLGAVAVVTLFRSRRWRRP
jgi:hypothetical protein